MPSESEFDDTAAATAPIKNALGELNGLADGFGHAMTSAFRRSVVDGKALEDVLRSIALSLSSRALNAALAPIANGIGSVLGNVFGAAGSGATAFETNAEAGRGNSFPGGASARGGAPMHVTFNVTTPDAQSFRRAEAEVSAMLARAVARGARGT